ncbi:MAG: hypothetical protein ACO3ZY_12530, partial [Phycisphaerales bacterium]
ATAPPPASAAECWIGMIATTAEFLRPTITPEEIVELGDEMRRRFLRLPSDRADAEVLQTVAGVLIEVMVERQLRGAA